MMNLKKRRFPLWLLTLARMFERIPWGKPMNEQYRGFNLTAAASPLARRCSARSLNGNQPDASLISTVKILVARLTYWEYKWILPLCLYFARTKKRINTNPSASDRTNPAIHRQNSIPSAMLDWYMAGIRGKSAPRQSERLMQSGLFVLSFGVIYHRECRNSASAKHFRLRQGTVNKCHATMRILAR